MTPLNADQCRAGRQEGGGRALNQAQADQSRHLRPNLRLLCINKDLSETLMQKKCADYANDANVSARVFG